MNIKHLLTPRVICKGTEEGKRNYPGSDFNTGDILVNPDISPNHFYKAVDDTTFTLGPDIDKTTVEQFPNLFRPLAWYEKRNPENMPEYVRYTENHKYASHKYNEVVKVTKWVNDESNEGELYFTFENDPKDDLGVYPEDYVPATKDEYVEYIRKSYQ